jgi:hypothetical protein
MGIVRDEAGNFIGIWIADQSKANDATYLKAALTVENLEGGIGFEWMVDSFVRIDRQDYKIHPNNIDDRGGCFIIFGTGSIFGD